MEALYTQEGGDTYETTKRFTEKRGYYAVDFKLIYYESS